MLTINLPHFTGYSAEDFLDFLQIHNPPILEVLLPKESDSTMPGLIIVDYCRAAYAGQLLHNMSSDFFHNIPDPESKGQFSFIAVTTDYEKLSTLLYFLMAACTGTTENEDDLWFDDKAANYFSTLSDDEELACPAFLEIMNHYS